jgi:hypothetical protein
MFKSFLASAAALGLLMSANTAYAKPMLYTVKNNAIGALTPEAKPMLYTVKDNAIDATRSHRRRGNLCSTRR